MTEHEEQRNRPAEREEEATQQEHGRTLGDTATSYSSVGGSGGGEGEAPGAGTGSRRRELRPGLGGSVDEDEADEGLDLPYTGEGASTRGSTFHENPGTGETADEEDGEFLRESLERRTRRYESG
jgi:hypothetical protein